jgi:hypothetical protein
MVAPPKQVKPIFRNDRNSLRYTTTLHLRQDNSDDGSRNDYPHDIYSGEHVTPENYAVNYFIKVTEEA